jgi:hypothetical protein
MGDLRRRGFELLSAMEPDLLQNDPTRILTRQVFGAIAQYDKAMLVARLKGARDRMKARCEESQAIRPLRRGTVDLGSYDSSAQDRPGL